GYSNLKIAYGPSISGKPKGLVIKPSGAGPASSMPTSLRHEDTSDEVRVLLDGDDWVAGVEHGRLQAFDRELHREYASSRQYKALFHASLLFAESDRIDHLVTGLPVVHFQDAGMRERLEKSLTGIHEPAKGKKVRVENVRVLPQPAGAYMDLVSTSEDLDLLEEGRIVIIDPGFFSVDWVTIEGGEIRSASSGSSLKAMSVLLEAVDERIEKELGDRVGVQRLERAMRNRETSVLHFGSRLDISPFINAAVREVAPSALTAMRQAMRAEERNVDAVLLSGGGAKAYEAAAADIFEKSRILVPRDPVLANARGFWNYGA
ncbi:MAG: plasmid stability protein StbA, partial [Chloroflexota bacterium]